MLPIVKDCSVCGRPIIWQYQLPAGWHWVHINANWSGQYPHTPSPQNT